MESNSFKHNIDNMELSSAQPQNEDFMKMTKTNVCCISYNSRGFGSIKTNFIKYLTSKEVVGDKLPILCNQENFILRDNSYKITNAFNGFQLLINPAV